MNIDAHRRKSDTRRSLLRHPMGGVGGALFAAGVLLFFILLLIDITGGASENPYRSLVTFVIAPFVIFLGLGLFSVSAWMQARRAKKLGRPFEFTLSFNTADPHYVRNVWIFLGISALLIILVIYSGTKAYEATDSVEFCGETCHVVMTPQSVTYRNSAHARVPCVACHIGPGASFYVRAKIDGIRQLYATAVNSFSRPIETPVQNLRPAQETCEGCHWPRQFYGDKMITKTYYKSDEDNSPWTIKLLVKIGGGNPRTGKLEGIHWHMIGTNAIDYIAEDEKHQEISWVRLVNEQGDTTIYKDPDTPNPDLDDPSLEIRRFDCMDCHNRPSHSFLPPANAMNLALSTRRINPILKNIRALGLELLNAEYSTRKEANKAIEDGLYNYYKENYPDLAENNKPDIYQAKRALHEIYNNNFFPEMNTDYRVRENNLSHFVNDGCFRCHDGIKENQMGIKLSTECTTCHLIVSQGPSENVSELESNLAGLRFHHPEDIDDAWEEMLCTECHTPESGY